MSKYINGVKSLGNGSYVARAMDTSKKYRQRTFSAGTAEQNKTAARDWVHNQERIRNGLSPSFPLPEDIGSLVEFYLESVRGHVKDVTLQGYAFQLRRLLSAFGPTHSLFFHQQEIDNYVYGRRADGTGRGIIAELACLRNALQHVQMVPDWNIPRFLYRLPKKMPYIPTPMEYRSLLHHVSPDTALAIDLALYAGLRNAEVYRVPVDCYTQSDAILRIPASIRKITIANDIPVVGSLKFRLDTKISEIGLPRAPVCVDSGVFVGSSKSVVSNELRRGSNGKIFGLQPFRRLFVTMAEDIGYDPEHISLITGHKRSSMVARYAYGSSQLELKRKVLEDVEQRLVI